MPTSVNDIKLTGIYMCTGSANGAESRQTIELRVNQAPEMDIQQLFIHTSTGNKAELVCKVRVEKPVLKTI